jgi:tetratricopeptide (TPR) repeat protein
MSRSRAGKARAPQKQPTPTPPTRPARGLGRLIAVAVALVVVIASMAVWRMKEHRPQSTPTASATTNADVFAAYAGSASCRDCHQAAYKSWQTSHHALAERAPQAALEDAAFEPPRSILGGASVRRSGTAYEISALDLSGSVKPHAIARVIGHDPLRQYLVPAPGGRFQATELAYDPNHNDWFDVYGDENRQPGEWGHWTGRGMNWNAMCAVCHNTRLRKNYDEAADGYQTTMAEMAIGCESCHGPMKAHVQWQRQAKGHDQHKDPTLPHFTRDQSFDTCGTCHSRRGELTGDYAPGESFFDHYNLTTVDGSDTFYPDGQIHEEDYEFSPFLGSKMYAANVRCIDCHDPHSSKPILAGNLLCMRCHAGGYPNAPLIDPVAHTFHKAESPGAQCVNCHMPQTNYMQRHGRHDHGFTTPDPLLTKELGIPNACNRCHTDKDASWALTAAENWYGAKMNRPARDRARAVAAARRGEDAARAPLLAMLENPKENAYWKSAAIGLLGRWAGDPNVAAALTQQLGHEHPLARSAAIHALAARAEHDSAASAALRPLLVDPVRGVRVAAASALMHGADLDPDLKAVGEFTQFLQSQADQPSGQLQEALLWAYRRDPERAVGHLHKAVEFDSRSAALRREVAVMYDTLGLPRDALNQIQEACRLEPNNADYQYLLGLMYNELGQRSAMMGALEKAVALDPRHARAWYNLGLARRDAGNLDAALDALQRAEGIDATDADIPYARATILKQINRLPEARAALARVLELRPDYPGAAAMLESIK